MNNENIEAMLHQVASSHIALFEQMDLNSRIDECTDQMMKDCAMKLAHCVRQNAGADIFASRTPDLQIRDLHTLLVSKHMPTLSALKALARKLLCDLELTFIPVHSTNCAGSTINKVVTCCLEWNESKEVSERKLTEAVSDLSLIVSSRFGKGLIRGCERKQNMDSFFSTREIFRAAVSRLYKVELCLRPAIESAEWNATVI